MPVSYIPDADRRQIRVIPIDPVMLIEMTDTVERQFADGLWACGVLIDLRSLHKPPSVANAQTYAAHVRMFIERYGPRGPVAMVARDPVILAGAQIYKHFSARPDRHFEVFWSASDAEAWLEQFTEERPAS